MVAWMACVRNVIAAFRVRATDKNGHAVNYRLRSGHRTATLCSSGRELRRGAETDTSCCPWVAADSPSGTAMSRHGVRSANGVKRGGQFNHNTIILLINRLAFRFEPH